jgi:hypothetical protein
MAMDFANANLKRGKTLRSFSPFNMATARTLPWIDDITPTCAVKLNESSIR